MISGSLNPKRRRVSGLIADSARPGATIARVKGEVKQHKGRRERNGEVEDVTYISESGQALNPIRRV